MFHKELDRGEAGDNMGALLRGVKREQIKRGMVISAPGTVKPVRKFEASCYILTKEEGGRYTPFMNNYRPQLFIRTSDVTVGLTFPEGTENPDEKMVMPGDNVDIVGNLVHDLALSVGDRFTFREGGKTGALNPSAAVPSSSRTQDSPLVPPQSALVSSPRSTPRTPRRSKRPTPSPRPHRSLAAVHRKPFTTTRSHPVCIPTHPFS